MRYFLLLTLLTLPLISFGDESPFVPLVGIPYVDETKGMTLGQYVNALYLAAISIAAVLAVLRIIFSGVQYMLTDVIPQKSQAKKNIFNALIGLILIIAAFLILQTINDELTNLEALKGFDNDNFGVTVDEDQPPIMSQFEETCLQLGGEDITDCKILNCDLIDDFEWSEVNGFWSGLLGYGLKNIVAETADAISCTLQCRSVIVQGEVVEGEFGDRCIYVEDIARAKARIAAEETDLIDDAGSITPGSTLSFGSVPFESSTVIDDRAAHPNLVNKDDSQFLGFLTVKWNSPEGESIISQSGNSEVTDVDSYFESIIKPACAGSIVITPAPNGRTNYYCMGS